MKESVRRGAAAVRYASLHMVRAVIGGLALSTAATTTAIAQPPRIPLSQHGEVTQRVGLTDISIVYNRPSARGRVLFGPDGVVRWDVMWHPGADSASRITFSHEVTFEGRPVKAGTYSFWTIPRESGTWTLILSDQGHVFHTRYPGPSHDAVRVEIATEKGAMMETLAYYFPAVARDSTVLRLHWGEVILPMRIRVLN